MRRERARSHAGLHYELRHNASLLERSNLRPSGGDFLLMGLFSQDVSE